MYAVIRETPDGRITVLKSCKSVEAVIIASQLEKSRVSATR